MFVYVKVESFRQAYNIHTYAHTHTHTCARAHTHTHIHAVHHSETVALCSQLPVYSLVKVVCAAIHIFHFPCCRPLSCDGFQHRYSAGWRRTGHFFDRDTTLYG